MTNLAVGSTLKSMNFLSLFHGLKCTRTQLRQFTHVGYVRRYLRRTYERVHTRTQVRTHRGNDGTWQKIEFKMVVS